jgi:hypothetical protein
LQYFIHQRRTILTLIIDLEEWCSAVSMRYIMNMKFTGGIMFESINRFDEQWQVPPVPMEELPRGLIGDEI